MRSKDILYLGICNGNFNSLEQCRRFIAEHNLILGLKRSGKQILIKVNSEGWMTPDDWRFNYEQKIKQDVNALIERIDALREGLDKETCNRLDFEDDFTKVLKGARRFWTTGSDVSGYRAKVKGQLMYFFDPEEVKKLANSTGTQVNIYNMKELETRD